jgi:hypothetical protein
MKYLLLASGMALGLALQPVQAAEQDAAQGAKATTHEQETLHAPTNRVGDMVPTMTAPSNTDDATAKANDTSADGEHKAETIHPPTNRVGDQVPTMKAAENKDDRKTSTTTNNSTSSN